jgi:hypothetical protein
MNMKLFRETSYGKDVRVISLASWFRLVSMYSKEMPGIGMVFLENGIAMRKPIPGASFSSKMKLLRR